MKPEDGFPVFFVLWIVLCIVVWTFYWKGSLDTKRRWHPRILIGTALLFLAFVATTMPFALPLAVPAVAGITFLNFKMIKFCSACEATLVRNPPWSVMRFCIKCGAALDPKVGTGSTADRASSE